MAKKNLNNIKKCKLFHLNVEINERDSHANRLAKRNSVWKNEMTNDGRMKEMTVPKMTKLEEGEKSYLAQGTENLPHLKAGNKTRVQTRKKDSKEEGGGEIERKEKIKQKQHRKKARHSHAGGKAEAGDICKCSRPLSPFHAAPASVQSSWCTSGPPASALPPLLHSARSEPFYR